MLHVAHHSFSSKASQWEVTCKKKLSDIMMPRVFLYTVHFLTWPHSIYLTNNLEINRTNGRISLHRVYSISKNNRFSNYLTVVLFLSSHFKTFQGSNFPLQNQVPCGAELLCQTYVISVRLWQNIISILTHFQTWNFTSFVLLFYSKV